MQKFMTSKNKNAIFDGSYTIELLVPANGSFHWMLISSFVFILLSFYYLINLLCRCGWSILLLRDSSSLSSIVKKKKLNKSNEFTWRRTSNLLTFYFFTPTRNNSNNKKQWFDWLQQGSNRYLGEVPKRNRELFISVSSVTWSYGEIYWTNDYLWNPWNSLFKVLHECEIGSELHFKSYLFKRINLVRKFSQKHTTITARSCIAKVEIASKNVIFKWECIYFFLRHLDPWLRLIYEATRYSKEWNTNNWSYILIWEKQ